MLKQLSLIPLIMNAINVDGNSLIIEMYSMNGQTQRQVQVQENHSFNDDYTKIKQYTELNNYVDLQIYQYSAYIANNDPNYEIEYNAYLCYIMQITPYYRINNTDIDMTLQISLPASAEHYYTDWYDNGWTTNESLANYMDTPFWVNNNDYYESLNLHMKEDVGTSNITTAFEHETSHASDDLPEYNISITAITEQTWVVVYIQAYTENIPIANLNNFKSLTCNYMQLNGTLIPITPNIPDIEVIDIPGLMFYILTLPFAFISQAFDLTLFEGTAYQINVSKLFLGLIGIAILLWVLKLILGKVSVGDMLENSQRHRNNMKEEKISHQNKMAREQQRHENAMKEKRSKK